MNPNKSKVFFGSVNPEDREAITRSTGFEVGKFSVRYLGVPLSSKKLSILHYLPLIDKIIAKVRHWSTKLLNYAGRIVLVNSIICSLTQFWMFNFPLPKAVINRIDRICRTFVWTGKEDRSRKNPVAWQQLCRKIKHGGLNLINLQIWNKVTLLKCLWNIQIKNDNLWVLWIHNYYLKGKTIDEATIGVNWTWIIKNILNLRSHLSIMQTVWNGMIDNRKFSIKTTYEALCDDHEHFPWRRMLYHNLARPKAKVTTWLLCHGRFPTKERLTRFGILQDKWCNLCNQKEETNSHLFFECPKLGDVWKVILKWIGIDVEPREWNKEKDWIMARCRGKGVTTMLLKIVVCETIHECWLLRNRIVFGNEQVGDTIDKIINCIMHRGWVSRKLRIHLASLMS